MYLFKPRNVAIFVISLCCVAVILFRAEENKKPAKENKRSKEIKKLLLLIQNKELIKKDRKKVVKAILRLGELDAWETAPQLVELLDFHVSASGVVRQNVPPTDWQLYPAMKALYQIGPAVLPAIFNAIAVKKRSLNFEENAWSTVYDIIGDDRPLAKQLFLDAAYQESKTDAKKRLKNIVKKISYNAAWREKREKMLKQFWLVDIFNEALIKGNPEKVRMSILKLGERKAWEILPSLVTKLDLELKIEVENKNATWHSPYSPLLPVGSSLPKKTKQQKAEPEDEE